MYKTVKTAVKNDVDEYFAWSGIIIGTLLCLYFYFYISSNYIELGISLIFACVLYLALKKKSRKLSLDNEQSIKKNKIVQYATSILFLNLFTLLLVTYHKILYTPSINFYILLILLIVLVAIEITTCDNNYVTGFSYFILLQIILISLILRLGPLFQYPGVLGTDAWYHMWFSRVMLENGGIPSHLFDYANDYARFPTFHILITTIMQFIECNYKLSSAIGILFFEVVGVLVVYVISSYFFNTKMGLLSALLLSITDIHIHFGWWIVPTTLGLTIILFIIYLIFTGNSCYNKKILTIFLFIFVMLTHPFSSIILMFFISIIFIWTKLRDSTAKLNGKISVSSTIFILFFTIWIGYWMYYTRVFDMFIDLIIRIFIFETQSTEIILLQQIPNNIIIFNRLFFVISLFFTFIGLLYSIHKFKKDSDFLAVCFLFIISLVSLFIIQFFIKSYATESSRWFLFIQSIQTLITPIGITLFSNHFKKKWVQFLIIPLIFLIMSAVSITGFNATVYSPINSELQIIPALTESESIAFEKIYMKNNGIIAADMLYIYYQYSITKDEYNPLENTLYIEDVQIGNTSNRTILLIRDNIFNHNIIINRISEGGNINVNQKLMMESIKENKYSEIYNSNTVKAFVDLKPAFHISPPPT